MLLQQRYARFKTGCIFKRLSLSFVQTTGLGFIAMRPKIQSSQAPLAGHRAQLFRRLACNFTYGVNAIVLGDDRLERASLVNDATKLVNPSDVQTVYFSVVSCQTLKEWLEIQATALIKATSTTQEDWIDNAKTRLAFVGFQVPTESAFEATFRLTLAGEPTKSAIMAVQALPQYYAERDHRQWVVCMDGFDRLLKLDDDNLTFQKLCRTVWQHQQDVTYCLTGAKTMGTMFLKQRHPLSLFGDIINVD